MRGFVYWCNGYHRDDTTKHGMVTLKASGHLDRKGDDDQTPQQDRINYDCPLCEAGILHTEARHEEELNPE